MEKFRKNFMTSADGKEAPIQTIMNGVMVNRRPENILFE